MEGMERGTITIENCPRIPLLLMSSTRSVGYYSSVSSATGAKCYGVPYGCIIWQMLCTITHFMDLLWILVISISDNSG